LSTESTECCFYRPFTPIRPPSFFTLWSSLLNFMKCPALREKREKREKYWAGRPVEVVVDQLNIKGVNSFKTKHNPPIGPYSDKPKPLQVTFQGMKPVPRQIKCPWRSGSIKDGQNFLNRFTKSGSIPLWSSRAYKDILDLCA
jgi:hypothetical protein